MAAAQSNAHARAGARALDPARIAADCVDTRAQAAAARELRLALDAPAEVWVDGDLPCNRPATQAVRMHAKIAQRTGGGRMQLDIFDHGRDVMLRHDPIVALLRRDAAAAGAA